MSVRDKRISPFSSLLESFHSVSTSVEWCVVCFPFEFALTFAFSKGRRKGLIVGQHGERRERRVRWLFTFEQWRVKSGHIRHILHKERKRSVSDRQESVNEEREGMKSRIPNFPAYSMPLRQSRREKVFTGKPSSHSLLFSSYGTNPSPFS